MSQIKKFTVGGVTYNAAMASAVGQDQLLGILTGRLANTLSTVLMQGKEPDGGEVVALLMSLPYEEKQKIAGILLAQVFLEDTNVAVSVKDFAARMVDYNTLLAELLQWNLADFFTWLVSDLKSAINPTTPKTTKQ